MRATSLLTLLLCILTFFACGAGEKPLPSEIEFQTDFAAAKEMAQKSDKPMIIDFYTDWCKWCKVLDTVTYVDPVVIGLSVDNIFVKIDAEADTALTEEYAISGYPTIVLTNPDGEEIDRIWGYMEPADFYNQIQLYLQGKETLEDYLSRLEDEPGNLDYLSKVGEKYASRSMTDIALEYYMKVVELDKDNSQGFGADAMSSIADSKSRSKDYDGAIKTCAEMVELYPGTEYADDAAARMGYYAERKEDKVEAMKLYNAYLKAYPEGENAEWITKRLENLKG